MHINKPIVIGLGGVGSLVARSLRDLNFDVVGMDQCKGPHAPSGIPLREGDVRNESTLAEALQDRDAVISCLPYHLTTRIAKAAHRAGIHYFDPTEDIASTQEIIDLSSTASGVMIPQNGLAPGFIGILTANLASQFDKGTMRHIKMRVGALPQHPIGQLGYSSNWSLEGLVHEYLSDCDVIVDGNRQNTPGLRNPEILRIHGVEYEAFSTSGGLGTMTETYKGQVEVLNYKSIRYPGHHKAITLMVDELRLRENPELLIQLLKDALPPADQDRVLIHTSVQGEIMGLLQTREIVTDYKPIKIGGETYKAIAWTTAAAIVAVVELVAKGRLPLKGFVRQEDIPLTDFLETETGSLYAKNHPSLGEEL
jgi:saccharopine dehydrogenase (NAD+, L-lysine-forming)